jgi:hypothetical protein
VSLDVPAAASDALQGVPAVASDVLWGGQATASDESLGGQARAMAWWTAAAAGPDESPDESARKAVRCLPDWAILPQFPGAWQAAWPAAVSRTAGWTEAARAGW